MRKEIFYVFIFVLLVGVLVSGVYAVGSSSNYKSKNVRSVDVESTDTVKVNCGNKDLLKDRIKCRIENKVKVDYDSYDNKYVHESCRNLGVDSKERCRGLYNKIQECYDKSGIEKDRCFKLKTGFAKSAVSGQGVNKEKARDYLVTLLYDLEERVEKMQEEGKLEIEESTDLIAKIIEIKEKILTGVPGDEIRPMIQNLKKSWRQALAS